MTDDQVQSCSQKSMGASSSNNQVSEDLKPLKKYYEEDHISRAESLGSESVFNPRAILLYAIDVGLREFEKFGVKHSKFRQDIREDNFEEYRNYLIDMLGKGIDFDEVDLKDLEKAYEHLHGENIREMVGRAPGDQSGV
ncbi:MAG: hypothetical protein R6V35_03710 [Candidatus Nanohaloarchaea archaeon]